MKIKDPEWHKDQFDKMKEHPVLWFCKADELRRASEICWDQYMATLDSFPKATTEVQPLTSSQLIDLGLINVSYLLLGLAFENLIKGIYQKETGKYPTLNHNTEKLLNKVNFTTTPTDLDLLHTLSDIVRWSGRYHLPIKKEHYDLIPLKSGGWKSPAQLSKADKVDVMNLYCRLADYTKTIEPAKGSVP